jgi:hypothetical protein
LKHSVTCLNQLPADDSVSNVLSPFTILTGKPNPDYNKMTLEFGLYVQIFEPPTFAAKTLRSRTTGAISLNSTGNIHGHFYFLSLITGCLLSCHQLTSVPMTDSAIDCVKKLSAAEDQPWIEATGLLVEWHPKHSFDDDDNPDYVYTAKFDNDFDTATYPWDDYDESTVSVDNQQRSS